MTESGRFYAVANYYPAGNYKGEYEKCVPRPLGSSITTTTTYTSNITYDSPTNKTPIKSSESTSSYMPPSSTTRNLLAPTPYSSNSSSSSSPSAQISSGSAQDKFIQEALSSHNTYRKKHGVDPLIHNPELSKIAQNYAEQIANSNGL